MKKIVVVLMIFGMVGIASANGDAWDCVCLNPDKTIEKIDKRVIDKANAMIDLRYAYYNGKKHAHHDNCIDGGGEFLPSGKICTCYNSSGGALTYYEHKCQSCDDVFWFQRIYPK